MKLEASTVLLQWAAGGLFGLWLTTRLRVVGIGYGWLLRGWYLLVGVGAVAAIGLGGRSLGPVGIVGAVGLCLATTVALVVSVIRREAGVSGQIAEHERKAARVAGMTGGTTATESTESVDLSDAPHGPEFAPVLDLFAPVLGLLGLFGAASQVGGSYPLSLARLMVGAVFLGLVTDAMLLGHWYLVQPGLRRDPIKDLVRLCMIVWPLEVIVFLLHPGMIQVLSGQIDDGWGGLMGWIWLTCAVTTIGLLWTTWLALRERYYSAVMAATGLLYLAILTAFGQDLIARAVLS
jgi:hypothetical protein